MTEESKRDEILRKVRGLVAKANSTEFEGERAVFMAKADQLMEQYAIETWMVEAGKNEQQSRLVVKRQFNMSWWHELGELPHDCKSQVWHLFAACAENCRCYVNANGIWESGGVPVWGLEADLDFLNMLFTDLFVQLFGKIKPAFNPALSLGQNITIAKEAGMKWTDIAVWIGHPEWRVPNGNGGWKTADHGKMKRENRKYLESIGKGSEAAITIHPHTYAYSFLAAFTSTVRTRFREMNAGRAEENTQSGAALVLLDIKERAASAAYSEFPAWQKSSGLSRTGGGRRQSTQGYALGGSAGANARIASRSDKLGARRSLDK